jgi:hypothetical protein
MPTNYVCLDDEAEKVSSIVALIEQANKELKFEVRSPQKFDSEVRGLGKNKPDGLLIDLRLDRAPDSTGERVSYRAISLAQELRTRMTEGELGSFPIVLWSVDDNFKQSYRKDATGHDLFDGVYYKGDLKDSRSEVASQLLDLASGYKSISLLKARTVKNIYGRLISLEADFDVIDPRISGDLATDRGFPSHAFARSILNQLIHASGPLVDEATLAARLGVDANQSADWNTLTSKFADTARYTGIFGNAWPRWWMFKIAALWKTISPDAPLQRLQAEERVTILKRKMRLQNLVAVQSLAENHDTRYWHVCRVSGVPVAPADGVLLAVDQREWHDGAYASLKAILERQHKAQGLEIHPFERDRINELMSGLRNG